MFCLRKTIRDLIVIKKRKLSDVKQLDKVIIKQFVYKNDQTVEKDKLKLS